MKRSIIALACAVLAGCGSFGHTQYTVESKTGGDGKTTFDLKAADGKEFASRTIKFSAKDGTLEVNEGASKAFTGQKVGAKILTILPVNDLDKLGDK